jgi:hypothetical protein
LWQEIQNSVHPENSKKALSTFEVRKKKAGKEVPKVTV